MRLGADGALGCSAISDPCAPGARGGFSLARVFMRGGDDPKADGASLAFLFWEWVKAKEGGLRVDVESLADCSKEVFQGGDGDSKGPRAEGVAGKSLAETGLEMRALEESSVERQTEESTGEGVIEGSSEGAWTTEGTATAQVDVEELAAACCRGVKRSLWLVKVFSDGASGVFAQVC